MCFVMRVPRCHSKKEKSRQTITGIKEIFRGRPSIPCMTQQNIQDQNALRFLIALRRYINAAAAAV